MRGRRVFRWAAWVVLGAITLVLLAWLAAETPWGRERIRRVVVSQANAHLNGELQVRALTGSILTGVTLHDVVLRQHGQPVVSVEALTVSYSLTHLISNSIVLDHLTLTRPSIRIAQDRDGWNVTTLVAQRPQTRASTSRSFAIRELTIIDGVVHIEPSDSARRDVTGVSLHASLRYAAPRFELKIDKAIARDASTGLALKGLAGALAIDEDHVTVDGLDVETADSHIRGHLRFSDIRRQATVDVTLSADPISIPEIAKYLPEADDITLTPRVEFQASGPIDHVAMQWNSTSSAGTFAGHAVGDLAGAIRTFTGQARVRDLDLAPVTGRPDLVSSGVMRRVVCRSSTGCLNCFAL